MKTDKTLNREGQIKSPTEALVMSDIIKRL